VGGGDEALVQFNLSSLGVTSVSSATLLVWVDHITFAGGLDISIVTSPWNENSVTLSTQPTIASSFALNVPVSITGAYLSIDVTSQVNSWLAGLPNYGFAITAANAEPATVFALASRENPVNEPAELSLPGVPQTPEPASWLLTGAGLVVPLALRALTRRMRAMRGA
jgi:hypothetical protein